MKASGTLRAPAKLNLTLEVLSRRSDGLHALRTVMVPVDLCDELQLAPAERFTFTCDDAQLQQDNLVARAVRALNLGDPPVRIALHKRIPTGGGMGGGSSDGAAILLAAQSGVFGKPAERDYLSIARSLGSDVPFFLAQSAALVEGAGERVTPLGAAPFWHAVVIKPPVCVPTAWAYEQLDALPRATRARNASASIGMVQALTRDDFQSASALLQNDFRDAVASLLPEISRALAMLADAGAAHRSMTGSGSCVFALVQTAKERDEIADRIAAAKGYEVFRCSFWNSAVWRTPA